MVLADDHRTSEAGLLDEFRSWMAEAGDPYPDNTVANAAVFAEWRRTHATGRLDAVKEEDIVDFLLDWCARRMTINAEESTVLCASIGSFLEFLGDTGRLAGGFPARRRVKSLGHEPLRRRAQDVDEPGQLIQIHPDSPRFQSTGQATVHRAPGPTQSHV
jgi:hypothetical protein